MQQPARSIAGAAIAETAVIVSFVLLLMFGTVELIEVGYLQAAADGAVFLTAHEYAIGSTNPTAYASPFPGVKVPSISFSAAPPENTQVPVDYQVNQTTTRYGGVQLIRPQHLQAKYQATYQGLISGGNLQSLPINGGAVEARYMMSDRGFSVDGWTPNSSSTYSNMIDPLLQDDQNVPPYYIGMRDMLYCNANDLPASYPAQCSNGGILALGLAEYLDHDNYSSSPGANGVATPSDAFYQMACHQRIYATIAVALPQHFDGVSLSNGRNNDPLAQADANYYMNAASNGNAYGARSTGPWRQVYDWDRLMITNSGNPYSFQSPLHPEKGC